MVFIRDNHSGHEFVMVHRDYPQAHSNVLCHAKRRYPTPNYTVHTCYSENELQGMLKDMKSYNQSGAQVPMVGRLTPRRHAS